MGRLRPNEPSRVETFSSSSHSFRRLKPFLEADGPIQLHEVRYASTRTSTVGPLPPMTNNTVGSATAHGRPSYVPPVGEIYEPNS